MIIFFKAKPSTKCSCGADAEFRILTMNDEKDICRSCILRDFNVSNELLDDIIYGLDHQEEIISEMRRQANWRSN